MKARRWWLAVVALAACQSTKDVPASCEDLKGTCGDGWTLTVQATTAATYSVAVTFGGATTTLSCVVPGGPCTGGDDRVHGTVGASGITVGTSHSPASVTLVVTRGNDAPVMHAFTPSYGPSYPNGTDCSPTCAVATDTLAVP